MVKIKSIALYLLIRLMIVISLPIILFNTVCALFILLKNWANNIVDNEINV